MSNGCVAQLTDISLLANNPNPANNTRIKNIRVKRKGKIALVTMVRLSKLKLRRHNIIITRAIPLHLKSPQDCSKHTNSNWVLHLCQSQKME